MGSRSQRRVSRFEGGASRRSGGAAEARAGRAAPPGRRAAGRARDEPERGAPRGPRPWSREWLAEWGKTIVFALIIFLFLRTFIVESFVISSGSMEETLLIGDFLLVNKVAMGPAIPGTDWRLPGWDEPKRGEIVVFRADHAPGLDLVKRVAGVPGDTLRMAGGMLYVNGVPQEETYVQRDPAVPDVRHPSMAWQLDHLAPTVDRSGYEPSRDDWGPLVVPPLRYFMLGDNREHSLDSRFWGLVERQKVKGSPFFIYWSYDQQALKPFRFVTAARPGRVGPPPD